MKLYLVEYKTYQQKIERLADGSPLFEPRVKEFGHELPTEEFLRNFKKYLGNEFEEKIVRIGLPENAEERVAATLLCHDLSYTWLHEYAEDDNDFREDAENLRYAIDGIIDALLRED